MKTVEVYRHGSIPGKGTFGDIRLWSDDGTALYDCHSVEPEWRDNIPYKSCIPAGEYLMQLGMYYSGDGVGGKKDYPAYLVLDVPGGRDQIKLHVANKASQLLGCIAPGEEFGIFKDHMGADWGVGPSWPAFNEIMRLLAGDEFVRLKISWRTV